MIRKLTVMLLGGVICLLGVTSALAIKYNEAPMLKTQVAAGELPSIEKRLPEEPAFCRDVFEENVDLEIGQYGGTLRLVQPQTGTGPWVFTHMNESLLRGPGISGVDIEGNILKDFEASEDGKVFTFYMRKGLRWSDGYPVTTEDVLFAYEDFLLNKELTPVFPIWLKAGRKAGGEPMRLEIIDEYTFRISFAEPYGGRFLRELAIVGWRDYTNLLKPKHYLKKFHPRYTPLEELEPLIKQEGLSKGEWWTLFKQNDIGPWTMGTEEAIGAPVLTPWITVRAGGEVNIYERNPYYFKIDKAGNQLPYIDRIRSEIVQDAEMVNMKMIAGEVGFRASCGMANLPILKENSKKSGYRVLLLELHKTAVDANLNLTYEDPVWREVVRDIRFRKALNMAINREEIIDAVYYGFAELPTLVPSEYNPEKANQLLDEMGLEERDKEGWRLGPDGKTFVIHFETDARRADFMPVAELVVEYWKAVGIKTTLKKISIALWGTRNAANQLQATTNWHAYPPLRWSVVEDVLGCSAPVWALWYTTNGEKGEEPPMEIKRFIELDRQAMVVSLEETQTILDELDQLLYENIFAMYLGDKYVSPAIASNNLGNVPHSGFGIDGNFSVEQFFFRE